MEKHIDDSITIYEWRKMARGMCALGPDSDYFYCDIADKFLKALPERFRMAGFSDDDAKLFCVRLSLYLEDVVSDLGIFKAFRSLCKEITGRDLPFYNSAKIGERMYREDKVNEEDIRFLLWDYLQISSEDLEIITPFNSNIENWAKDIYNVLYQLSKKAPKNEMFYDFLYTEEISDFTHLRTRMTWLLEGCYMTSIYYFDECVKYWENRCHKLMFDNPLNPNQLSEKDYHDFALEEMLYFSTSRQFGLPLNKFYARMLRLKHYDALANEVEQMIGYHRQVLKVVYFDQDKINAINWDNELFVFDIAKNFKLSEREMVEQWKYLSVNVAKYSAEDYIFGMSFQTTQDIVDGFGLDQNWEARVQAHQEEKEKRIQIYHRALELTKGEMTKFFPNKQTLYEMMGLDHLEPISEGSDNDPFFNMSKYLNNTSEDLLLTDGEKDVTDPDDLKALKKFESAFTDEDADPDSHDDYDEWDEEDEDEDWDEDGEEDWDDEEDDEDWDDDDDEDWEYDEEDKLPNGPFGKSLNPFKEFMEMLNMTPDEVRQAVMKFSDCMPSEKMDMILEGLKDLDKIETSSNNDESQVMVVHKDQAVTHYYLCVPMLKLPNNPYYNPNFRESAPFEYGLLTCFDYEFAKYLYRKDALIPTKNAPYSEPVRIRKFILENFEYLASYFYHKNFRGYRGGELVFEPDELY